ncbi:MAG: class I SAM-dependent methyltransferase [Saprospiraceae bacterium]
MEDTYPSLRWKIAQWFEIRWWQRYLAPKDKKHYLQSKRAYWQRILQAAGLSPLAGRVLDAGCGPAGIFMALPACEVTAFDPLLSEYETRLAHFSRADYPWVNFHTATLEAFQNPLPFPLVCCLNAINHVDDWHLGMQQLARHTQAGGMLLLGIDVHNYRGLRSIFRLFPGDILHPHQHDREDYLLHLQALGFEVIATQTLKKGFIFDYWLITARKCT